MSETMMFNVNTREQRYMSSADHQKIESLKAEGWLSNPRLVHMHNPRLNKDFPALRDEIKTFEDQGYYCDPTMIYHPEKGTKKVSGEDARKALKNGWYASPAHFPGNDVGVIKTPGVMKEAS